MRLLLAFVLCVFLSARLVAEERKFTPQGAVVSVVTDAEIAAQSKTIDGWLLQAKTARSEQNREAAASALVGIASRHVNGDTLPPEELALVREALKTCAFSPDAGVRQEAVRGLAKVSGPDAVPAFASYIAKHGVNDTILEALGQIGDAAAVKLLIQALNNPRQLQYHSVAAKALGEAATDEAAKALEQALKRAGKDQILKEAIERALDRIDEKNSKKVKF